MGPGKQAEAEARTRRRFAGRTGLTSRPNAVDSPPSSDTTPTYTAASRSTRASLEATETPSLNDPRVPHDTGGCSLIPDARAAGRACAKLGPGPLDLRYDSTTRRTELVAPGPIAPG